MADPFDQNSNAMLDGGIMEISADALVTVTGSSSVPEPAFAPLLCMLFTGTISVWWRKRRTVTRA